MSDRLIVSGEDVKLQAERLGVSLSAKIVEQISEFCSILTAFNQHTNLVANCEAEVLMQDHILDSLSLVPLIKDASDRSGRRAECHSLVDIGSGGGFPGLVLAMAEPFLKVALVEAVAKKGRFLSEAIATLSLEERVEVLISRAELLAQDGKYRHRFDYATCRALGPLPTVLELSLPFLKPGGRALIQRSKAQAKEEESIAVKGVGRLKATLSNVVYPSAEILGKERAIIVFEQKDKIPRIYPRRWPQPKQEPLF